MSSKISKKLKFLTKDKKAAKAEAVERNKKLKEKLRTMRREREAQKERSVMEGFTKWRLITYAWVIFLPPYGLYRIWSKESTFMRSEKVMWTFMILVSILYFFRLILFS